MMRAVGIILAGGTSEKLGDLSKNRATSAMPVGSCYRAVDFSLSNMSNAGIKKVAVITQSNSRSLNDHLSSSKWWELGSKQGGLFVFTPFSSNDSSFWFRGTADSIYQNMSFLKRSNEPYVVIASGDGVYKMDYSKLIKAHVESKADITVVSRRILTGDVSSYGVMEVDSENRVLDFEEKPLETTSNLISLGIYIIQRTLLMKLLETIIPEGRYDFVRDILFRYRKKLRIMSYEFNGYWNNVNNIKSYYQTNMDFLDKDVREHFAKKYPYIHTKPKDEPPAKYNYGAEIHDCLVGAGSILNGYVEHSVFFRKVFTGENSYIKNSVIMEGSYIGNNCVVENAIFDKEVILSDGKKIIGTIEKPAIITKGTVV